MVRKLTLSMLALLLACHAPSSAAADTNPPSTSAHGAVVPAVGTNPGHAGSGTPLAAAEGYQLAAFAEGCFWGSEDTFRHVNGVVATAVGYTGGRTTNPSYEDVCTHLTGHAETVLVEFDPKRVTYPDLLQTFWDSHDPTTPNQQGPDIGDQYRSAIFTFSPEQAALARKSLAQTQIRYKNKITTEVVPIGRFWKAEAYHQQFDERTGRHSCPIPHRTNAT
ncbi:MAG TPA: peptide-methionine (S)-S-oxide reductase MsrA [Polyangiaceae bacterium]|nr:peptide-methionine (S)-S-oxide reductase MsrA [Polyangiaceae bacterium]